MPSQHQRFRHTPAPSDASLIGRQRAGQLAATDTAGALQAVTFTVTGTRAEPVVSVNPLSSLAPGVMREWLRRLGL